MDNCQKILMGQIQNNIVDYLCISGSRLYGTNREDSDHDLRGFTIPPFEYLIGIKSFNDMDIPGADHKVYALKRFLDLVLQGDPQTTEMFFVSEERIKHCSPVGRKILSLKDDLLSNRISRRLLGFSNSEHRKAIGVKLIIEDRTKTEDDVIVDIRNVFHPIKDDIDHVIEILLKDKETKLVPSKQGLGAKRKAEFDKYGFGVSSAVHSFRLVSQLKELLLTGNITFPRPDAEMLKKIRYGKVSKQEFEEMFAEAQSEAEKAREVSILPDKPNEKKVRDVYAKIIKEFLMNDERFFLLDNERVRTISEVLSD